MPPAAALQALTPFSPFSPTIGAAAFWLFVAACGVTSLLIPILVHRETQRTIRLAIEKGQTLDAATLDRLMRTTSPGMGSPEQLLIGGLIVFACGPGLAIMGWFIGHLDPKATYPLFGVGALVALVGSGMIVGALVSLRTRRQRATERDRGE